MTILAGDIGGTKTVLALVDREKGCREPLAEERFSSRDYSSLTEIVDRFLNDHQESVERSPVTAAAFGVAGPVKKGVAQVTNLPWKVRRVELAKEIGIPEGRVKLLNDLEATATAVPHLGQDDCHTLNAGKPNKRGPIAVVAPGTGLGQAFLVWTGRRYRACPSEGGHAGFAPTRDIERELLAFLSREYKHVSIERVCSGLGIPNIYRFLRDEKGLAEPVALTEAFAQTPDPVPLIIDNAMDPDRSIPLTRRTLEMFVLILAAEAGNAALRLLATGGVYLGGGIPPRILSAIDNDTFRETFCAKGRFASLLADIPVYVVLNSKTALLGAAYAALAFD